MSDAAATRAAPDQADLAFVLSGGGANAAFEVGVIAALAEAGYRPDVVTGSSAGAINAAALSAGFGTARLEQLWTGLTDDDVYRLRGDVGSLVDVAALFSGGNLAERALSAVGWEWLFDPSPLRDTLTTALGGERVPQSGPPAVVSAVALASGRLRRFATAAPPGPLREEFTVGPLTVDMLLASAAIPLLFKPGEVDGEAYWDGGVLANTPLGAALAYRPRTAVVVTTATLERPSQEPSGLVGSIGRLVDASQRYALETDLRFARTVNQLARAAPEATDKRAVEVVFAEPDPAETGASLSFRPGRARSLIEHGREVGEATATRLRASRSPSVGSLADDSVADRPLQE